MNVWNFNTIWTSALTLIDFPRLVLFDSPVISSVAYTPSSLDLIDPDTTVRVYLNVSDAQADLSSLFVKWKKTSDGWESASIAPVIGSSGNSSFNSSYFDLDLSSVNQEGNYTFRVFANDSKGHYSFARDTILPVFWDCSFTILPSNGNLGATGGFNQQMALGNVTLNNTGDSNYSTGCVIKFARTSSGSSWYTGRNSYYNVSNGYGNVLNFTLNYYGYGGKGLYYFVNGTEVSSVTLSPGEYSNLEMKADFPIVEDVQNVLNQYPYFPVFANVTDTTDGETNKTIRATMVITPGAYLVSGIESPSINPYTVYLTPGNHSFSAYVYDIVSGADGANNTAYNVSFNWTLPDSILAISNYTNLTYFNQTVNDTNRKYLNFTLMLNETNIVNLGTGRVNVSTYAFGYENSTGILQLIDQGVNGLLINNLGLDFTCKNESDGICVESCHTFFTTSDQDCGYCGNGIVNSGETCSNCAVDAGACVVSPGSSSGGGGISPKSEKSEANFELIHGQQQEFDLEIKNNYESALKNLQISVAGINSEYITLIPSTIPFLQGKTSEKIKVKINAPSYFTEGKYDLKFTIEGQLDGNGTNYPYTQTKLVTLYILDLSRGDADNLKTDAERMIKEMSGSEMETGEIEELLKELETAYGETRFSRVKEVYEVIKLIYNNAFESKKIIEELYAAIEDAEKRGIDVTETKKLLFIAETAFNRGDYALSLERLKEAKLAFALETKGEFNLIYEVKNKPFQSFGILILVLVIGAGGTLLTRMKLYKRKLKLLAEEEKLLLELMKVVQKECFEKNRVSMEEYEQAMSQYKNRLSEVIEDRIRIETRLSNLLKVKGKKVALVEEKKRLISLIRDLQDRYLNKSQLETRIYENMMKSYSTRLTEVEEELTFLDAQEALKRRGRFIK
jgi:hypothetical protein